MPENLRNLMGRAGEVGTSTAGAAAAEGEKVNVVKL